MVAQCERHRDSVLLDGLVGGFSTHPGAYGSHENLCRREEGQIAVEFTIDDGREGAEVVEHREKRLEQAVDGEE